MTSGMVDLENIELRGKIILLNFMCLMGVIVLVPFGVIRTIQGIFNIGITDLLVAFVLILLWIYNYTYKNYVLARLCGIAIMTSLFGYLTLGTGYQKTGLLWSYTLPPICLFLLDRKRGSVVLALYLTIIITCLTIPASPFFYKYNSPTKLIFTVSFITTWIMAYYFEYIMSSIQREVHQKNIKLQQALRELSEIKDQLFQAQKMEAIGRLAG